MDELVDWLRTEIKAELARAQGGHQSYDYDPCDTIARCEAELRLIDYFLEPFENGNLDEEGMRLLASGYRYRDGYKPEWRP